MKKAKIWLKYGPMLPKNNILVMEFVIKPSKKLKSKLKIY